MTLTSEWPFLVSERHLEDIVHSALQLEGNVGREIRILRLANLSDRCRLWPEPPAAATISGKALSQGSPILGGRHAGSCQARKGAGRYVDLCLTGLYYLDPDARDTGLLDSEETCRFGG